MAKLDDKHPIPGYGGKYAIDTGGVVWRKNKSGYIEMRPQVKRGALSVRLTDESGKRATLNISALMRAVFFRDLPPDVVLCHRNGDKLDNRLYNLRPIARAELGRQTGGQSRRKAVAKIAGSGEVIDLYPSARQAAKSNYFSYQTVIDRCNGRVKSRLAPDGYQYSWADELEA